MKKKSFILILLVLFSMNLLAVEEDPGLATENTVGFTLLNTVIEGFKILASSGSGGYDQVDSMIQKAMADARAAKEQEKIDAHFFKRYNRILLIIKLAIIEKSYDSQGIMDDLILQKINEFAEDVTGLKENAQHRGIAVVAAALAEEMLNLQIYLEGIDRKQELMNKFKFDK